MSKNGEFWKISKNGKKMIKRMKVPNFLLKINASILHPLHCSGKKFKKCLEEAHGSAQKWKKTFFYFRPISGMR